MRLDPTSLRLFVSELEARLRRVFLRGATRASSRRRRALPLNLARGALHDLDEIDSQMRDYSSGTRGYVRVFANISAITQFLPGS